MENVLGGGLLFDSHCIISHNLETVQDKR